MYTFGYVNIPNVTAGYGRFSDLIVFFWEFSFTCTYFRITEKYTWREGVLMAGHNKMLLNFKLLIIEWAVPKLPL